MRCTRCGELMHDSGHVCGACRDRSMPVANPDAVETRRATRVSEIEVMAREIYVRAAAMLVAQYKDVTIEHVHGACKAAALWTEQP